MSAPAHRIRGPRNIVLVVAAAIALPSALAAQPSDSSATRNELRQIEIDRVPWTGDFDGMFERRHIRVLIPYSRTLFFVDKGRVRGLTAELAGDFEQYLNRKYAKKLGRRPITVSLIPTTRDKLLPDLARGLGDIAAGNLTVTSHRLETVDFVEAADRPPVTEVLVSGPTAPAIATLESLSGRTVDVRQHSSYFESLVAYNVHLASMRRSPIRIVVLPDALEDEDVLEMVNAGLIPFTVVDSWKAHLWAQVLPKIEVRNDLVLRNDGREGWAIRHGSPKLRSEVETFYTSVVKRQGIIEARLAQYGKRVKQISNNTKGAALKRFESTLALFKKYGHKYDFDPLMLEAQGYQESRLEQRARSQVGAIGVMQIMPATGAEMKVGNIENLEPNIHAGAKYMDVLMDSYFRGAHFSETDRSLFAFASYNAGPGNISRMRKLAEERGLNPNQWFDNVELVVAQKIGMETTTYVRNIYKYFVAYKLTLSAQEAQKKARQAMATTEN